MFNDSEIASSAVVGYYLCFSVKRLLAGICRT
jgi:hypothetical protein